MKPSILYFRFIKHTFSSLIYYCYENYIKSSQLADETRNQAIMKANIITKPSDSQYKRKCMTRILIIQYARVIIFLDIFIYDNNFLRKSRHFIFQWLCYLFLIYCFRYSSRTITALLFLLLAKSTFSDLLLWSKSNRTVFFKIRAL